MLLLFPFYSRKMRHRVIRYSSVTHEFDFQVCKYAFKCVWCQGRNLCPHIGHATSLVFRPYPAFLMHNSGPWGVGGQTRAPCMQSMCLNLWAFSEQYISKHIPRGIFNSKKYWSHLICCCLCDSCWNSIKKWQMDKIVHKANTGSIPGIINIWWSERGPKWALSRKLESPLSSTRCGQTNPFPSSKKEVIVISDIWQKCGGLTSK